MGDWTPDDLRPRHSPYAHQPTLFPMPLERFETESQVSADEMRRWHQAGWLSFDPANMTQVDWGEDTEVRFIRALARSGMNDEWITIVLAPLSRPFCYEPATTFFSFATRSWISLPTKPDSSIEDKITALADAEDWESLRDIRDMIDGYLPEDASDPE